jgi:hypothetical protein
MHYLRGTTDDHDPTPATLGSASRLRSPPKQRRTKTQTVVAEAFRATNIERTTDMTATIDRLHAVAAKPPLRSIPTQLDAAAIAGVLDQIDMLSPDVKKLVAAGTPLGKTGHIITIEALDKVLAPTGLAAADKIRLKMALSAEGLLASTDRLVNTRGRI